MPHNRGHIPSDLIGLTGEIESYDQAISHLCKMVASGVIPDFPYGRDPRAAYRGSKCIQTMYGGMRMWSETIEGYSTLTGQKIAGDPTVVLLIEHATGEFRALCRKCIGSFCDCAGVEVRTGSRTSVLVESWNVEGKAPSIYVTDTQAPEGFVIEMVRGIIESQQTYT